MNREFTVDDARLTDHLLFECVTGSRAYGTAVPSSDEDIKGVFVMPRDRFFASQKLEQVNDCRNDTVFYEVGRFIELLEKNNPTVMEMLFTPAETVKFRHPLMNSIQANDVLSKRCRDTFGLYAATQIRKARGLNKKIVNPMPEKRKTLPEFCYVINSQGSVSLTEWLSVRGWRQENCGLVKIPHMRDMYGIYHDSSGEFRFRGIWTSEDPTSVRTSSIPKEMEPAGWMSVNIDGFKKHCREYQAYWDWVRNRNEDRYQTNQQHGRGYDSKNLMHTIRLLEMALEIAKDQTIHVRRPNSEFLLRIREGAFEYEEIVDRAEGYVDKLQSAFARSTLPEEANHESLSNALIKIREAWYGALT